MKRNTAEQETLRSLFSVIQRARDLFKQAQYFGTDTLLHFSEIHLIEAIGQHHATHIAEFATLLGVTKAAISQTAKKLEKKGLLRKTVDPANHSRYLLELTAKGNVAFEHHQAFHQSVQHRILEVLNRFSPEERTIVRDFLRRLAMELSQP